MFTRSQINILQGILSKNNYAYYKKEMNLLLDNLNMVAQNSTPMINSEKNINYKNRCYELSTMLIQLMKKGYEYKLIQREIIKLRRLNKIRSNKRNKLNAEKEECRFLNAVILLDKVKINKLKLDKEIKLNYINNAYNALVYSIMAYKQTLKMEN